jgi:exopolysaccharide biosynthesis polyprenyl glycosylphosphotransferase
VLAILAASMLAGGCYVWLPVSDHGLISAMLLIAGTARPMRSLYTTAQQRWNSARPIVILGSGPMATQLLEEIESLERSRPTVAGVIDKEPLPAPWGASVKWLGAPERLGEIVDDIRPSRIVVAVGDRRDRLPMQLLLESRVRGIIVEDGLEFYERVTGKVAIEALKPSALIHAKGFRNGGASEVVARIVSLVLAVVGLILSAPLLAAIAAIVKLDSSGPVFFVQERAGRRGRPFGLLKFRTMRPCEARRSEWVQDNADRITRVGRWLRRFRLDEVPQLVNVIKGDMNLVGPRPHPTCNHQIFTENIAYYPLRSAVRPGVTGWAQVRYGYANDLEQETEKMRYDLYYIKNRSLWLDARILLNTIHVVLGGKGASRVSQRPSRPFTLSLAPAHARHETTSANPWLMPPPPTRSSLTTRLRADS